MTDSNESQEFTMPSNPADRKKIKETLQEMAGALQFIDDKRAYISDSAAALQEEFKIPKKIGAKMARTLHKNNYQDVAAETNQFETLFEILFRGSPGVSLADLDDSDED